MRGQSSVDYVVGLGLILVLATGIILPALRSDEITVALAAARVNALSYLAANQSVSLDSLTFNVSANNTVFISPTLFFNATQVYDPGLKAVMVTGISQVLSPASYSLNLTTDCVHGLFNVYCIVN